MQRLSIFFSAAIMVAATTTVMLPTAGEAAETDGKPAPTCRALAGSNLVVGAENAAVTRGNEVSVAFNAGASGGAAYLVAWAQTDASGGTHIVAARVRADGTVLDAEATPLAVSPAGQTACNRPRVASNGDSWLVAWDQADATGVNVYAARIKNDGTLLDAAPLQATTVGTGRQAYCGSAASDGTDYLVVWSDNRDNRTDASDDIRGARIRADGTLVDAEGFIISNGTAARAEPEVCYGGGKYLVVWRDARDESAGEGKNLYAAFVTPAASVTSGTDDGGGLKLTSGTDDEMQPACAWSPAAGAFLVSWLDLRSPARVMASRLSVDGAMQDSTPELGVGLVLGRTHPTMRLKVAAVAGPSGSSGARWAVVWDNANRATLDAVGVLGALVAEDGSIVTATSNPDGVLLSEAVGTYPAVAADAAGSSGANPLAVWFDKRASTGGAVSSVRGQFFTADTTGGPVPTLPLEAVSNASPVSGAAPLTVAFDGRDSAGSPVSYAWSFGDGTTATGSTATHIYNVAGTYAATLTVTDTGGATASDSVLVTVSGAGAGTVTGDMNFRWATTTARFQLNHARANRDRLKLTAVFNTVDLPRKLGGVDASFSINGLFTVSGVMTAYGTFENTRRSGGPRYVVRVSPRDQLLTVLISRADLSTALAASGATNATVAAPGLETDVTYALTVGAQSYRTTVGHTYISRAGRSGRGEYHLRRGRGNIVDGFFVVSRATALENLDGNGHFCEFDVYLARPNDNTFAAPTSGNWVVTVGDYAQTIPYDRFRSAKGVITFTQTDRDLSGVRRLRLDTRTGRLILSTWDLPSAGATGTGLPLRGESYTAYNLTLRLDLDQPDGTVFRAVTATRLTRHTKADALWQTGRRHKSQ